MIGLGKKGLTVSVVPGKNSTVASPSTEQLSATTGFLRMMKRTQLLVGEERLAWKNPSVFRAAPT